MRQGKAAALISVLQKPVMDMHKISQHPTYIQNINTNYVFTATAFKQNTQGYLVSFQNSKNTLERECFMIAIKGLCQYALLCVFLQESGNPSDK